MTPRRRIALLCAALLALFVRQAILAPPAAAQPVPRAERQASGTLSEATYRQLERIHELIGRNEEKQALERAQALLTRVGSDYERAVVRQTMAFIHVGQNDYKAAIAAFEEALALDALPQQPYEQMLYNVAQLYFQDGRTGRTIERMELYFREVRSEPTADAHILLASAYAERKRYDDALQQVDLALARSTTPKEAWLQLKLALHYELRQLPQCAEVLLRLVALVPAREDYWKQLSGILFEIGRDRESLAVLALAERQGFLDTESELRNLANIYLLLNIPYKAARILEGGLEQGLLKADGKSLGLIGDAWTMAREYEKAEAVFQRAAALAGDGEIDYRLGQIYVEDERWPQALEALRRAQGKGPQEGRRRVSRRHRRLPCRRAQGGRRRAAQSTAARREPRQCDAVAQSHRADRAGRGAGRAGGGRAGR
jgi:tetratricopeptide (TPR) repeat protein